MTTTTKNSLGSKIAKAVAGFGIAASALAISPPTGAQSPPVPSTPIAGCAIDSPTFDFQVQISTNDRGARLWRFYQANFQRQPDQAGFDYWLEKWNAAGVDYIANHFSTEVEFVNTYGPLDNDQFIALVYNNVMCRTPDTAGHTYWLAELDAGRSDRGQVMASFSDSDEYRNRTDTNYPVSEPTTQAPPVNPIANPIQPVEPAQPTAPAEPSGPFKNCTEVREAGRAPIRRGEPGYSPKLDRDGDGIACEN